MLEVDPRGAERSAIVGDSQVCCRDGYDIRTSNEEDTVWTGTDTDVKNPHGRLWGTLAVFSRDSPQ